MLFLARLMTIKRFVIICFILSRQVIFRWPYRLLFGPGKTQTAVIGEYLRPPKPGSSPAEMAKETLELLGPTYVKFGQFMSIRPDLIPPAFCNEFRKLQDNVPPFPFSQVRKELNRELQQDYTAVFGEFDEAPVAAASVSQVHRARLRTGEEVAVKVQRPGIREEMVADILIMLFFAKLLVLIAPSLRKHTPEILIREFSHWTDRELYFRQEGKNALHFASNFKDYPGVRFPKIYRAYTTRKVLVMDYLRGDNILHAPAEGIDRKAVSCLIVGSMLKQIFIDGFFHGDPHAGNILLIDKTSIAYLDFGIVGYLGEDLRVWIFDILYAMSKGDTARVIDSFLELCNVKEGTLDLAAYRRKMNELLSELNIYEEAGIPFSQMMKRFLFTSLEFGIAIPPEFVLVTKALTTFEGTCLTLDPEIRIVEQIRCFVRKHAPAVPGWEEIVAGIKGAPFELERMKRLVLKHGAGIVKFLENPVIKIADGLPGGGAKMRGRTGENVAFGFIIAALIVFASTLGSESILEQWFEAQTGLAGVPVLPFVSMAAAGVLFVRLLLRNRAGRAG